MTSSGQEEGRVVGGERGELFLEAEVGVNEESGAQEKK